MTAFCTYFDRNYLPQGLALHRSLLRQSSSAELWILCLDDETRSILSSMKLERAHTVTVDDLLRFDQRLVEARSDRPLLEFYYACTPQLIRYVEEGAQGEAVAYVDADVFFFGDPAALYAEDPDSEILLIEHRSGDPGAEAERGRFNLCFVHFEPTPNARRALQWWCDAAIQSTAMNSETWGDQKYLDRFPELFDSVGALRSPATTLAPWNVFQYEFSRTESGEVEIDGERLIAYHFARMLIVSPHLFSPARREWLPRPVLEWIYRPYMREIQESFEQIRTLAPDYSVTHMWKNRRGLMIGLLFGRLFYDGRFALRRLGVYIPNTRKELRARKQVRQRARRRRRPRMADARPIGRHVRGRRLLRRLLRSRPARWAKPVLISILEGVNALVRRVGASTHERLMQVEWGIPPTPEWFDHYQDVYFHWPITGNSLFLEPGVFANLAVEPGAQLLDLCCGDGFNSRFFYAHRASKVVAVDFDRGAILHAKRFNTVPNIEFVLADIRDWIPDGTFDNIMWDAAIEHFTESEIFGIMRSIRDRLVPTGVLSGYTVVERPGGKQLVHHEREFRDKADLLSLITPHFEHARVFETEYPSRTNLYFYATNHESSLPFSLKNPRFLRS